MSNEELFDTLSFHIPNSSFLIEFAAVTVSTVYFLMRSALNHCSEIFAAVPSLTISSKTF